MPSAVHAHKLYMTARRGHATALARKNDDEFIHIMVFRIG